ncbi:MAG: hypothetical protein CVU59_11280 [Deltaproteobacteria bacterium HGW-Deltaproteobacteria-17]|nr:MAG: hypothetical protein CVU59_11280 [Deltaproteobacteria bacterium HGW-Deltaproteobacteria-17]
MIAAGIFVLAGVLFLAATFTTGWITNSGKRGSIHVGFLSVKACFEDKCETGKIKKDEIKITGMALTTTGCLAAFAAGLAGLVLFMNRNRLKGNPAILGTKIASAILSVLFVLGAVGLYFVYMEAIARGPRKPDLSFGYSFYMAVFATILVYVGTFLPLTEEQLTQPAAAQLPPTAPPAE